MARSGFALLLLISAAAGCRQSSATTGGDEPGRASLPPGASDWKQLQGTWTVIDSSRSAESPEREHEVTVEFKDDFMTFRDKDGKPRQPWHFGLGHAQSPKQLDLVTMDPAARTKVQKKPGKGPPEDVPVVPGIYELNGDQLVIVVDWSTSQARRASAIDAPLEKNMVRYRLQRAK